MNYFAKFKVFVQHIFVIVFVSFDFIGKGKTKLLRIEGIEKGKHSKVIEKKQLMKLYLRKFCPGTWG